jgi:hypothetical protein
VTKIVYYPIFTAVSCQTLNLCFENLQNAQNWVKHFVPDIQVYTGIQNSQFLADFKTVNFPRERRHLKTICFFAVRQMCGAEVVVLFITQS